MHHFTDVHPCEGKKRQCSTNKSNVALYVALYVALTPLAVFVDSIEDDYFYNQF